MLVILGPILALGAFTALLAMVAGLFGWYRPEMLVAAAGVGGTMTLVALLLLYRRSAEHRAERQADHRALQNIEARVGGIVESAMDAIITVDEEQHIVLFNAAAEQVFGCPKEEAIGAPLARFIPARFREGHAAHIRAFGEAGTHSRRMGTARIVTGLRRNGEEFPIDASISQISEQGSRFYTVILRDVTERVRAEEALRRSKDELRDLSLASNSVREQEKSRIARELHDELAQALTALKMDVAWMDEHLPAATKQQADVGAKLTAMQQLLDHTVAATRRISADLRPLILDDLGLVPAAEWLVQNFTQRSGIPCSLDVTPPDLELEDPQATALFRILQESLTNVSRHANASRVEVHIEGTGENITLSVRDNGRGFMPQEPRKPNSYGLLGLRERVYLLGGEVDIDSMPGKGAEITVHIPRDAQTEAEAAGT